MADAFRGGAEALQSVPCEQAGYEFLTISSSTKNTAYYSFPSNMDPTLLIGDIVERGTKPSSSPDEFTEHAPSSTGFPQPKRRWKQSAFKQQRAAARNGGSETEFVGSNITPKRPEQTGMPQDARQSGFEDVERRRIDQENRTRMDNMTPQEIAQAQDDLIKGLNPDLVKRLLQRATIDEPDPHSPFNIPSNEDGQSAAHPPQIQVDPPAEETSTSAEDADGEKEKEDPKDKPKSRIPRNYDENKEPAQIPPDLFPITDQPKSTHFPAAPTVPDLDPADPNFLETLRSKYFPDLVADPSKLAWMAPVPTTDSPADKDSPYYPHPEIAVSALRFDFRGRFLSPRVSRSIPSSKGLHHHGEAPEAAGYTIVELARLGRSAVPAQRCMAFQTLGRILYRLGKGEWGKSADDPIAMGIWTAVKTGRVLETMMEVASSDGGHRGSVAFATEALWLFEKGGWKEQFKGR